MEEPMRSSRSFELQQRSAANEPANEDEGSTQSSGDEYPTGVRFVLLTVGLILSIFLSALDSSIVATAIPRITDEFGTIKDVGWYSTAYQITKTAIQPMWGRVYKFFPLRPAFLVAIALFEVGNVICAVAPGSAMLIFGRLVAGVGGSGIMTGGFIIIAMSAKPQYRAAYMGVLGVTFGISSIAGPLLGGFLTDGPGWRWCFWINLPIGFFAAAIISSVLRPPSSAQPIRCSLKEKILSLDLGGASLVLGSMVLFELGMARGSTTHGFKDWRTICSLAASGVLILLFLVNERLMGSRSMVQGHLFRKKFVRANMVYQFFIAGLFFPLNFLLPIQFQSVSNASAKQSGIRLIPLILAVSVFTMAANGILTFWRKFTPMLVFGAAAGTVGIAMIRTLGPDAGIGSWVAYEILVGFGVGVVLQVPMIANQAAVGAEDVAAVTALTLFVENIATTLFTTTAEAVLTSGMVKALSTYVPDVDPQTVVNAGATQIQKSFGASQVHGIVHSYLEGCRDSQLVPLSCGSAAALVSLFVAVPELSKKLSARLRKSA